MDASVTLSDELGNIKMHHTFNGAAPIPRGWVVCNGNVVNESNYNAIHGSGAYVRDRVALSPIAGKYTPNMVNRYPTGTSATTQSGTTAISAVGNASNQVNLQHNHQWYESNVNTTSDQSYNSGGSAINFSITSKTGAGGTNQYALQAGGIQNNSNIGANNIVPGADYYTSNSGSTSQSIRPDSIEVLFLIKVA